MSDFFKEDTEEKIVFQKKDFFVDKREQHTVNWIVPNTQKNAMEPILVELPQYGTSFEVAPHSGEEFGYVLKGNVVLIRGNKKYRLKAKETFYINGKSSHYLENIGNIDAKILWVTTPPMF